MNILDHVQALNAAGIPTIPCGVNKRPLTQHGLLDATTDPNLNARRFSDPAAVLIGVPTGEASGWDVLDQDPAGEAWRREHKLLLSVTRCHRTPRGGFHDLFKHREGVRNSAGRIAPGIDVRGDGGYFIWWPAAGHEVFDASPIAEMSDWLYGEIMAVKPTTVTKLDAQATPAPEVWDEGVRDRMLDGIKAKLGAAEEGEKHATLRGAAVLMGGILYSTEMSAEEAAHQLVEWLPDVADHGLALDTALSGIALGAQHPVALGAAAEFGTFEPEEATAPKVEATPDQRKALGALLDAGTWESMNIPEPDRLLGDVITTKTRAFLSGQTGLGKTMFAFGIAYGIASGAGFLHWKAARPGRVIYLDGEMPAELIKPRAAAESRRLMAAHGAWVPPGHLRIFGHDIEAEAHKLYPSLPPMAPLNTEAGRVFLLELIKALGKPDLIIFDNIMSLISGSQKEEEAWAQTIDLVQALSNINIGQLWLDHTGWNTERQYGSSTKAWRFDASMVIKAPKEKTAPGELAFSLTFDKARRRMPDNAWQFEPQLVRLVDDVWSTGIAAPAPKAGKAPEMKEGTQPFACYQALAKMVQENAMVTRLMWQSECLRKGIIPSEGAFRAVLSRITALGWVVVDGSSVALGEAGFR